LRGGTDEAIFHASYLTVEIACLLQAASSAEKDFSYNDAINGATP